MSRSRRRSVTAEPQPPVGMRTWVLETHHRVKNHLQLIAALLAHQARGEEVRVAEALKHAQRRILAVARLHDLLQSADPDAMVEMPRLFERLCGDFALCFDDEARSLSFVVKAEPIVFPGSTAVVLALVTSELVTNSVKHAYGAMGGEIRIELCADGPGWRLTVADDGPGLPADSALIPGVGGELVQSLVRQLRGNLVVDPVLRGTSFSVWFV